LKLRFLITVPAVFNATALCRGTLRSQLRSARVRMFDATALCRGRSRWLLIQPVSNEREVPRHKAVASVDQRLLG